MRKRLASWTEPPRWLDNSVVSWLRNPYVQMRIGAALLIISTITWWPLRHVAVVIAGEPEVVFHLSMFAVWLSGLTLVIVTDVGETVK